MGTVHLSQLECWNKGTMDFWGISLMHIGIIIHDAHAQKASPKNNIPQFHHSNIPGMI